MDQLALNDEIPQRLRSRARRTFVRRRPEAIDRSGALPMLLTEDDAADLRRTTRHAIYAMVERQQLPGIIRIRPPDPVPLA